MSTQSNGTSPPPNKSGVGASAKALAILTRTAQKTPAPGRPDLTLRDEANAITVAVFRNGFIEDLHAGRWLPILNDPSISRISDTEMKKLNIEMSGKLALYLYLRDHMLPSEPQLYWGIIDWYRNFTHGWERAALTYRPPRNNRVQTQPCRTCNMTLVDEEWRFCPGCGTAITAG